MDDMARQADQALVVRPGDTLVLRYERALTMYEVDEMRTRLNATLPGGVKVLIITGADEIEIRS